MAKEQAEYEVVDGFGELVGKMISLNEDRFGHIDYKMLRMTMITNKEPPCNCTFKIIRVNNPVALFCPFRYVVVTWREVWDEMDEDRKGLMICDILNSLEPDENEPKLIPPDVKAHGVMLRTFGVDYMLNPNIKGLFSKPIEWKDASDFDAGEGTTKDEENDTPDFLKDQDDDNAFGE
jgi:hypothetical protein